MTTEPVPCAVYWARPDAAHPRLAGLLDEHERDQLDRLRRPADRARYLAAHALARVVLADSVGIPAARLRFDRRCHQCGRPHGKPELPPGGGPRFSISHAGDRVALAVVPARQVGVDVERWRPAPSDHPDELAAEVLDETERAVYDRLPAEPRHRHLLSWWTRKEAVLKATGDGLRISPALLRVTAPDRPAALEAWAGPGHPGPLRMADLSPGSGYVAAVAVLGDSPIKVTELCGERLLAHAIQQ